MKRILLLGLVIGAAVLLQSWFFDSPFGDDHETNVEVLQIIAETANRQLPARPGPGLTAFRIEATDDAMVIHYRVEEGYYMDMEQARRAETQRFCGSRAQREILAAGFSIRILYTDHRGWSVGTLTIPPDSCLEG